MRELSILDPSFPVFGQYFLEASAGTGKTFTIEHLVPRLLLESQKPIELKKILIVTFTRAATRELKARVHATLKSILQALEEGKGGPLYLEPIFAGGKEKTLEAKRKIEEALFSFESAQIFTLHGFCLATLQEFAFFVDFFLSADDEMELVRKEQIKTYLKDFIRGGLNGDIVTPSQLKKVFSGKDLEGFFSQVLRHLESGKTIRQMPSAKEQLKIWNEALTSFPEMDKETFLHELALTSSRIASSAKWKRQIDLFAEGFTKGFFSLELWDNLLQEKELFFHKMKEAPAKNQSQIVFTGLFSSLAKTFVPLHARASDGKALLLHLAKAGEGYYQKGKKELSHYLPDDFVAALKKALQNESVQEAIANKYEALIIDEFQDTDEDQWDIFTKLFFKGQKKKIVYLVGDPKQSIYRFRSADVYVYLEARKFFKEEGLCFLGTNYRSHPDFIKALNHLFSRSLEESWLPLPKTGEKLPIRAVKSKEKGETLLSQEKTGRIHFFLTGESPGRSKKFPKDETEEKILLPKIAEEIIRLKNERSIPFNEVAILVKDRFQAARAQKVLALFGIGSKMQKEFSFSSPAYAALCDLLSLTLTPHDMSLLKRVLAGALIQSSAPSVIGGMENPLLQKGKEYFLQAFSVIERKGLPAFVFDLLGASFGKETVGERLLQEEGAKVFTSLRELLQILLQGAPLALHSPKELLLFLEELKKTKDKDLVQVAAEEEGDEVQLMTMHKSKGLEFSIVFALGAGSRHTQLDDVIRLPKEIALATEEKEAFLQQKLELDAEKLRQLYVAFTRTKERLYIPFVVSEEPKSVEEGTASPLELFLGSYGTAHDSFSSVYEKIQSLSLVEGEKLLVELGKEPLITYEILSPHKVEASWEKEEPVLLEPRPFTLSFKEEVLSSFSSLASHEKGKEHVPSLTLQEGELPAGAATGVVIHALLELLCKADLHRKSLTEITPIVQRHIQGTVLDGHLEKTLELVDRAFSTRIEGELGPFTLKEVKAADMMIEMEFLYKQGDGFIKGFIDMVFRHKGSFYLLDWKTNALENYSRESIARCIEDAQYDLQARLYEEAVRRYFSLFSFKGSFGGAIYFFLRGGDPYTFMPKKAKEKVGR